MVIKYIFYAFIHLVFTQFAWAEGDVELKETLLLTKRSKPLSLDLPPTKLQLFELLYNDPNNLIHPDFAIPDYFREATQFWFLIYTKYNHNQVVIHHRDHPSIIFHVLDVEDSVDQVRTRRISEGREQIQNILLALAKDKGECPKLPKDPLCTKLLNHLNQSVLPPPTSAKDRSVYFSELATSLRTQSGQRDIIMQGLHNLQPFQRKLAQIFHLFDVPGELIAVAFLESSFNTRARSRVGAAGIWQFMRSTGLQYFIITQRQDHRLNPLISTLGALQFLKQTHKILGRLDLAIWSYNSGMRHVLDARKAWKKDDFDLAYFLDNYQHRNIGFASKSFYSSYLALIRALAYKKDIYFDSAINPVSYNLQVDVDNINFYVLLCQTSPRFIFDSLSNTSPDLSELNTHLVTRYHRSQFPRGTIFVSDRPLTSRRYWKVPELNYTNRYPKNWLRLIGGQRCQ